MKYLLINSVCGIRSTGRICTGIAGELIEKGHEVKIAYGRETVPDEYQKLSVKIGSDLDSKLHAIQTRLFDTHSFGSKNATARFLEWADRYDPDVLWLHNLHGYYINVEMLFEWIKSRPDMQVKWTLHDCWAFTGHCAYFSKIKCVKWQTHCAHCVQKRRYPTSMLIDNCYNNFERKKSAFTGVDHMTLITPSQWLADLVKQSFLKDYPVEVHYNTIDTKVFKPTPSDFRKRYGLQNKKIILGVASSWGEQKGLDDFIKLSEMLNEEYAIVLVGLTEKQIKKIPQKIIAIKRTNSTKELAEIYTAADVYVNLSKEETFGMTTIEAVACETKAIVYKGTACEEVINNLGGGLAVEQSIEKVMQAIDMILNKENPDL